MLSLNEDEEAERETDGQEVQRRADIAYSNMRKANVRKRQGDTISNKKV